ncbi:MAG TPA: hypothetical protein VK589_11865 [Chryseolinea sp.]|nr:hypothetical protein [Chryseolinea sp.]
MIPKITQQKLDALAQQYATRLLGDVKEVFNRPEYINSGELADSVQVTIIKSTDNDAPVIALTYADQGFFIGYKNPQWTKLPVVAELEKWAAKRGLDFGNIPGYTYGTAPGLSTEKKIERIAWAIAKNKRKEDTWKQKKWKKSANLGDLLKDLNTETIAAYARDIEGLLADAISKGTAVS